MMKNGALFDRSGKDGEEDQSEKGERKLMKTNLFLLNCDRLIDTGLFLIGCLFQ